MGRARVILDQQAYCANLELLWELSGRKAMNPVIKANAYGHGAVAMARLIEAHFDEKKVPALCVARGDEALELREAGIKRRIIILSEFTAEDFLSEKMGEVTLYLSSPLHLSMYESIQDKGKVHSLVLNVDTGMHRLGFPISSEEECVELEELYQKLSKEKDVGIASHLACAEQPKDEFSEEQVNRLRALLGRDLFLDSPPKELQLSNSAGLCWRLLGEETSVRPGLLSYGIFQDKETREEMIKKFPELAALKAVASVEAPFVNMLKVKKGEGVGYGLYYKAPRDTLIGVLALGYADGVRRCSNEEADLKIIVDGVACAIRGRVTMDMLLVDLGSHPRRDELRADFSKGKTVFGQWIGAEQPAEFHAEALGTISYEILCDLGQRLVRVLR